MFFPSKLGCAGHCRRMTGPYDISSRFALAIVCSAEVPNCYKTVNRRPDPTVHADLPHDSAIAREEFFGPVALIFTFKTDDEAVRFANDSDFGLGGSVWSQDRARANAVAARLEAGAVFHQRLCAIRFA